VQLENERAIMRKVERIINSHIAPVGTFSVRRALPDHNRKSVGPWVFLDHFGPFRVKPGEDGVGPHPHAGIETVTYLLSGRNEHRDSAGHTGIVGAGGAQWMTSGRGIIHAEAPLAENEAEMSMHGIQLWTTLPRALKTMAPRYQRIAADDIPEVAITGGTVRVIAGEYADHNGPADVLMPLMLWHVALQPGARFTAEIPAGYEIAAYVISGTGAFSANAQRVSIGTLVTYVDEEGAIEFSNTGNDKLDVLLLGGAPAEGPLVFHGPFVMNSVEQVRTAEKAYMTGQMGHLEETIR
jgi:quercetin 2,3-dioxygenase